jgi:hypothetical protein
LAIAGFRQFLRKTEIGNAEKTCSNSDNWLIACTLLIAGAFKAKKCKNAKF